MSQLNHLNLHLQTNHPTKFPISMIDDDNKSSHRIIIITIIQ